MEKLISMTDFVLEQNSNIDETNIKILQNIVDYALFIKQPLTLGMFVPCDLEGNFLEEPIFDELLPMNEMDAIYAEYQEAKERVLFDGWELVFNGRWGAEIAKNKKTGRCQFNIKNYQNIEHVFNLCDFGFTLTESAKKQLGL